MAGYSHLLTEESISSITKQYGFPHELYIEKFIMDLEMHARIAPRIDCIIRGGLCMPFHLRTQEARRLSIDVDLLTPWTVDEVEQAMDGMDDVASGIKCSKHEPRNPYPLDNLISYYVYYPSRLQVDTSIKLDFFCDVDIGLSSELVGPGFSLFGFDTRHDMNLLSKGALLGDKITTIALGTIGLRPNRQTEIAKQVYDLGLLMRTATKSDLCVALDTFENMTGCKIRHFDHSSRYTVPDISRSIAESVSNLLNFRSNVTVTRDQNKRYSDFQGTYLAKTTKYRKTAHISDILLISLYSQHLDRILNGEITRAQAVDSFHEIVEQLRMIKSGGMADTPQTRESYMQAIPDSADFKKKILNGATLEHLFLVSRLHLTPV